MFSSKLFKPCQILERYLISCNICYNQLSTTSSFYIQDRHAKNKQKFIKNDMKNRNSEHDGKPKQKNYGFHEWQEQTHDGTDKNLISVPKPEKPFKLPYIKKCTRNQAAYRMEATIPDKLKGTLILFPGEGTQYVGMAKSLYGYPKVRNMYDKASEILGYDLYELSIEGPAEKLMQTKYQQPAILMASLAAVEKLKYEYKDAITNALATAGFGVGEISALVFAGAIHYVEALRIVEIRANAMQLASELTNGAMMTAFYDHNSNLKNGCQFAVDICKHMGIENPDCAIANYLFPECKVIAGNTEALNFLKKNSEQFGIKQLKYLSNPGAFNTKLMQPAIEHIAEAMEHITIKNPTIPVYSNETGKPFKNYYKIRDSISQSVAKPIKWEQIIHTMYSTPKLKSDYFPVTYEIGPGTSLKTLLTKVNALAAENFLNIKA